MKKTISALILSALLLVSLSACNKAENTPTVGSSQSEQSAIENSTPDESNKAKNPEKSEAESKLEQSESTVNKPFDGTLSEVSTDNPSATESKAEERKPATSKPNENEPTDEQSSSPAESSKPADVPTSKPVEVAKPKHTHSYTSKVVAPTCTDNGYTLYTCSCGDSYKKNETKATGHTWVKGSTVKPTCTDNGYTNYTCSVCGAKGTANETEATGHNWQKAKTVKATCTKDGYTSYKCSTCGESKKGKITEATGHSWGKWKTTKKATSTAEGRKERSCSVCGKKETVSIAKVDKYAAYRAPYDFDKIYDDMVAYGKSKGLIYDKSLWVKFNPKNGWDYTCNAGFYEPDAFANPNNAWSISDGEDLYNTAMEEIDYLIERMNLRGVPLATVAFNPFIVETKGAFGDSENLVGVLYG